MRSKILLALILVIALLSVNIAAAQDATEVPAPAQATASANPTIGDITGNHETYYGQQVTVQGVVEEFLNARVFVIGEGSTLLDNKLLVIDASGQEIPLTVARDQQVQLTGMVYPSIQEGGMDLFKSDLATNGTTDMTNMNPTPMMTESAMVGPETPVAAETPAVTPVVTAMMMPTSEVTAEMSAGMSANMTAEATGEASSMTAMPLTTSPDMATPMPAPGTMNQLTSSAPNFDTMQLPDGYADFTILVVNSVDSISVIPPQ